MSGDIKNNLKMKTGSLKKKLATTTSELNKISDQQDKMIEEIKLLQSQLDTTESIKDDIKENSSELEQLKKLVEQMNAINVDTTVNSDEVEPVEPEEEEEEEDDISETSNLSESFENYKSISETSE